MWGRGPIATALRGDIDALPIIEETGLPFASKNHGVTHACGHDVHTTTMLGIALVLHRMHQEEPLGATVRIIFQPAEETMPGGAHSCIEQGVLDGVPRILALHCDPRIEVGKIGTRIGAITSASDTIRIELSGRGGHTSRPHLTEDLVFALAQIAVNVPAVLSRRVDVRSGVFGGVGPDLGRLGSERDSRNRLHGRNHAVPGPRSVARRGRTAG
ncbi:amidohydrolase [Pseudarthrobacter sp. SLBN-100]